MRRVAGRLARRAVAGVWAGPLAALLAVTLPHLDQGDFRVDTQWYGAIGLQAWRTGGLWTLYADPGQAYFNKPPLALWIHGLALHALGPSLVAARLPSVLAAAGCVVATMGVARLIAGRNAAWWAGLTLALTIEFFRRVREISLDLWQAMFVVMALWAVVWAVERLRPGRQWMGFALAGVPLGLALMCKPLAGLLALVPIGLWLVLGGSWRSMTLLFVTAAAAVAVAAPWHVSMQQLHGPAFVGQYFGREIADRAAGEAGPISTRTSPAFYAAQIASSYWPWLIAAVGAVVLVARGRLARHATPLVWLAGLWFIAWFVALSVFADRRDRYALPYWPGLAMLSGVWLALTPWAWWARARRVVRRWTIPVAVVAGTVFAVLPVRVQRPPDAQWQQLLGFLREHRDEPLWQGNMISHRSARIYLDQGRWPLPTRGTRGERLEGTAHEPPAGALLVYHRVDGLVPGANEEVVFRSRHPSDAAAPTDLVVTRLREGRFEPGEPDGEFWSAR